MMMNCFSKSDRTIQSDSLIVGELITLIVLIYVIIIQKSRLNRKNILFEFDKLYLLI